MGIFGKTNTEKLKSKGDVKALHKVLVSPASSPELRVDAAMALLDLDATDVLRDALKHELEVRHVKQISHAFVKSGDGAAELVDRRREKARPILIDLYLNWAQAESGGGRTLRNEIDQDLSRMPRTELDPRTVATCVAVLRECAAHFRVSAADFLMGVRNADAVAALVACLSDPDEYVRLAARKALGETADAQAKAALAAALVDDLRDQRPSWRRNAIEALSALGRVEAVEPIATLLADPDPSVPPIAAHALARFGDTRGRDVLIAETRSDDMDARARATASLGNMLGEDEIPMLVKLLSDRSERVSGLAAKRLAELEWAPAMDETGAYYFLARGEVAECLGVGAKATRPLMQYLPDAWNLMTNYRQLLRVAGEAADSRIVPMLQNMVKKEQEMGGYGKEERIALAMSAITSIQRRLPVAGPDWIELMNLATLPLGEALVVDQKLAAFVTCPSCGATMSVRDAYRGGAGFLVCPRCDDDWLVRHLAGNYERNDAG